MKMILASIAFFFSSLLSFAQTAANDYYIGSKPKKKIEDRVSGSVMLGTSVSFLNSKNSGVTTFIAPKLNYKLTEKNRNEGCFAPGSGNLSGNLLFVGGDYKMNKKLLVSGSVMMETKNNRNFDNNFKAVSLGMEYKVSKHSSIGIKAIISEGNSDYMTDPRGSSLNRNLNNNSFGDPFSSFGQFGSSEMNNSFR
ncbi:MAG: hypothetical protein K0S44_1940 [Bacteroidetes bacterium]|nr:hypothetical protein [Bacteroidota bacterium]